MRDIAIIAGLIGWTCYAFWPVRANEFVTFDDDYYIYANPQVSAGLTAESMKWAFSLEHEGNWAPLTTLSHMLDCELFELNAAAHHTENVLWHAVNAGLVFLLFRMMTRNVWPSALVAALFALHPLRVESVAWATERKDVLSGFFGLLSMIAYVRFALRRSWMWYGLCTVCLCLSLLAKPMLVTLPALLLVLDWWPLRRRGPVDSSTARHAVSEMPPLSIRRLVLEKIPLLIIAIGACVPTYLAQRVSGSVEDAGALPLAARLANAVVSYARYLGKFVWPTDLVALYPHPLRWPMWTVAASIVLLIMLTAVAVMLRRRRPTLLAGWLWFLGTMVPTIGLVQVGVQAMADRYTYVPMIGLGVMLSWTLSALALNAVMRWTLTMLCLAALMILTLRTRDQIAVWKDSETLYAHALERTEGNWTVHFLMGRLRVDQRRLREARDHFAEAARINPNNPLAFYDLADVSMKLGRVGDGITALKQVLSMQPDRLEVINNLAWLLATQSDLRLRDANLALALATRASAMSNHADPEHLDTLAAAQAATGRFPEAVFTAQQAVELARQSQRMELAGAIEGRLDLYRRGQPYLENTPIVPE